MGDKTLFDKVDEFLQPPEWINFEHPEFPKYFQISVLDEKGNVTAWWQRLPDTKRRKLPPPL